MRFMLPHCLPLLVLLPCSRAAWPNTSPLILSEAPKTVKPYVIEHLGGYSITTLGIVFRVLVSKDSSAGAFSLLTASAPPTAPLSGHYHPGLIETFYGIKGYGDFYAEQAGRTLFQDDFHYLSPGQRHSLSAVGLDNEYTVSYQPGGIEGLYLALGAPYSSSKDSPFDPTLPPVLNPAGLAVAGKYNTIFDNTYVPNTNFDEGTTSDGAGKWRKPGQLLPGHSSPYFISANDGPKYLNKGLNAVIDVLATGAESGNNCTIGTVAFTQLKAAQNGSFKAPQALQVLEGQLTITIGGNTVNLIHGDTVFVPGGTSVSYSSVVAYTRVYIYAAGTDSIITKLVAGATSDTSAVPPAN